MTFLKNILFLAAYTSRSQAYAQALYKHDFAPERVLLFGDPAADQRRVLPVNREAGKNLGIFLPNMTETLTETCDKASWSVECNLQDDVNHQEILMRVKAIRPEYIIYSGYSGQLVKPTLLNLGIPILHMHSGWLPEYAGSTTLYYSWLQEGRIAVSAFILDHDIDTGPLIAQHHYPAPPPGTDVDHLYDGAVRASTLVHILNQFAVDHKFPEVARVGVPKTYYVIHPVLKQLAILTQRSGE